MTLPNKILIIRDLLYLKRKATYLHQTVRLTGLGVTAFGTAVVKINDIYKLMSGHITSKKLIPWQATHYEGSEAINASARYFTLRRFVPNERGKQFGVGVDTGNLLAAIRGQDLIHGDDNKVDYLKEYKSVKEKIK